MYALPLFLSETEDAVELESAAEANLLFNKDDGKVGGGHWAG